MVIWAGYIVMFVSGLVLLITGKVTVSKRRAVQGAKARLIGLLLCAAVPLTILITVLSTVVALLGGMSPQAAADSLLLNLVPLGCMISTALVAAYLLTILAKTVPLPGSESFTFTPPGEVRPAFTPPAVSPLDTPPGPPAS